MLAGGCGLFSGVFLFLISPFVCIFVCVLVFNSTLIVFLIAYGRCLQTIQSKFLFLIPPYVCTFGCVLVFNSIYVVFFGCVLVF